VNRQGMKRPETVQEALAWASFCLSVDNSVADPGEVERKARAEAEQLVLWCTGWSRTQMLISLRDTLPPEALKKLCDAVAERIAGRPLQYITGEAPFYGRVFAVNPDCLIPRPETEVLVESAIAWLRQHNPAGCVLDIGTGSGAISITLALECPQAEIHAIDLSSRALRVAVANAERLGARVTWHVGDGVDFLHRHSQRWNMIVSNPPYIPTSEIPRLATEVRDHEPRLALDGGEDGLVFYRRLAAAASEAFADGPAALLLEVGRGQDEEVVRLFTHVYSAAWRGWRFSVERDLRGIGRVVVGQR
jgi:release factor glutamine methyltransferase